MLKLSWLLPLPILFQEMSAFKKKRKIRGNKMGQVPGTSKKKVRREVKIDKCPTVELGVQDAHLRGKKNKRESISFSSQSFKEHGRYVSPQRAKVEFDFHHCYHHHHHTPFIRHTCTS